jgi:hypothetical protein
LFTLSPYGGGCMDEKDSTFLYQEWDVETLRSVVEFERT